jgi:peptide deformylase
MPVKELLLLGAPSLREPCNYVSDFTIVPQILEDLKDTLNFHQEKLGLGRGIAAPQIGYPWRIVYIQTPERTLSLINPVIIYRSPLTFDVWDSCLCFNAAFFVKVSRHKTIRVEYHDREKVKHVDEFIDDWSELLQHEIDHLNGILAIDQIKNLEDIIMREEWEKRYRKS